MINQYNFEAQAVMPIESSPSIAISCNIDETIAALKNEKRKRAEEEEKKHFSGFYEKNALLGNLDKVFIVRVIYSNPATIVFWSDDTKTVSKCREGDVYNEETGLLLCVIKKLVGPSNVREMFKDWTGYDKNIVSIKDVRKRNTPEKKMDPNLEHYLNSLEDTL